MTEIPIGHIQITDNVCSFRAEGLMYDDGYNVGCKDCGTYVSPFLGDDADNKMKHIIFWNTRHKSYNGPEHRPDYKDK